MNFLSKKLLYIIPNKSNEKQNSTLIIFDIEEEKSYKQNFNLRIISNLKGISQLNVNNTLYCCGLNEENKSKEVVLGSYMFQINCDVTNPNPIFLVNSNFSHFSPSMSIWHSDFIIVVGGKNQIECEGYLISKSKWIELPPLPEERYKSTLFSHEKNNVLYLFGGFSNVNNNNSKNILRLNMELCDKWDIILIKDNDLLLGRNSSVSFMFESDHNIYICGGKDDKDEETDFICQYNIYDRSIVKSKVNMKSICSFNMQGYADLNKNHFAFIDNHFVIHCVNRNDFKWNVIPFDS